MVLVLVLVLVLGVETFQQPLFLLAEWLQLSPKLIITMQKQWVSGTDGQDYLQHLTSQVHPALLFGDFWFLSQMVKAY